MKYTVGRIFLVITSIAFFIVLVWSVLSTLPEQDGLVKVKVQLNWFPDGEHAYWYLAKEEHLFEKHGFAVEIVGGRGSELAAKMLAGRSVNFALIGPDALLAINQQGGSLKSLGVIYDKTPVVIYSLSDSKIDSFNDLAGKKLGVLIGSNTYIQYKGLISDGVIPTDIEEVPVDGRSGPELLNGKKIDALTYYGHYVDSFSQKYHDQYSYKQLKFSEVLDMYGMVLATNEQTYRKLGPERIKEFVAIVREAISLANDDSEKAIRSLLREYSNLDAESEKAKLDSVLNMACNDILNCSDALSQNRDGWITSIETILKLGVIEKEKGIEKLIPIAEY